MGKNVLINVQHHGIYSTCHVQHEQFALEWGRALLLALIVKHHDVSEILLKITCVSKALSAKDHRNLFYLNRIINQTSHVWPFIYC